MSTTSRKEKTVLMGFEASDRPAAETQHKFGYAWQQKGKPGIAISHYRNALRLCPSYAPAYVDLCLLLVAENRFDEALQVCLQGIETVPNEAVVHKTLTTSLARLGRLHEAFDHYGLQRADDKPIDIAPGDILCCSAFRNERLRLPYFLSYYRRIGVARFFIVDNHSTDGTLSFLLRQPDVHVWNSGCSFNKANFGSAWFEVLLRTYGENHWCVTVDADELLYYPDCETKGLKELTGELDLKRKKALTAVLLDMYSNKPILDTHYTEGEDFLETCPYFDSLFYHEKIDSTGPFQNQTLLLGGLRQRVFGPGGEYHLQKVPLLKYDADCILYGGQHWIGFPSESISSARGAVLHFKYFADFGAYVDREVVRKEHYGEAFQYVEYQNKLSIEPSLCLYDPMHSVEFEDSRQLMRLGVMREDSDAPVRKMHASMNLKPLGVE